MYNFDDLCQYAEYSVLIYSEVTMQLPSAIVDFYLHFIMGLLICKYES